mgnify:CR=1 FL=1
MPAFQTVKPFLDPQTFSHSSDLIAPQNSVIMANWELKISLIKCFAYELRW